MYTKTISPALLPNWFPFTVINDMHLLCVGGKHVYLGTMTAEVNQNTVRLIRL